MEFINMAIQASRPDGKPPVPIWVTTEDDLVCRYLKNQEVTESVGVTKAVRAQKQLAKPTRLNAVFIYFLFQKDEESGGEQTSLHCTIMARERIQKAVSCNSLYPFVCTRTAGKSNAMSSPNITFLVL